MNDINMSIVNYLSNANEVLIKFSEVMFSSLYTSSFGPLAPNLLTPIKFVDSSKKDFQPVDTPASTYILCPFPKIFSLSDFLISIKFSTQGIDTTVAAILSSFNSFAALCAISTSLPVAKNVISLFERLPNIKLEPVSYTHLTLPTIYSV